MTVSAVRKTLLGVLAGIRENVPPIWLMRQAGRYLPEYQALRKKAGGFFDLCFNASLAAEATLQPIRRFGFDAAILFSDILVVPYALGQRIAFDAGEGPLLDPLTDLSALKGLRRQIDEAKLEPVFETIVRVKQQLPHGVTLLGFCGAPWTLATYMIAGRATIDQIPARLFSYRFPEHFAQLVDVLVEASADFLIRQFAAGVDAVQIFDSWAGVLPSDEFKKWCIEPCARIVKSVRKQFPDSRIIGFPRGAATQYRPYIDAVAVDAVAIDWTVELKFARDHIQVLRPIQGNLDPLALLIGGAQLDRSIDSILEVLSTGPFIFNLGHGVLPDTPIAHVERLIERVRSASAHS